MATCGRCNKTVYAAEEKKAVGKSWHDVCFKCKECNRALDSLTLKDNEGEIYCGQCHLKLYGPKGFRGGAVYEPGVSDAAVGGLDADMKAKQDAKFDSRLMSEVSEWIKSKVDSFQIPSTPDEFGDALHDGVVLGNLANSLKSGSVAGVKASKVAFAQQELIGKFLSALPSFGMRVSDAFMTVDLYEKKNIPKVIDTLLMLKRKTS
jgi:transcription elongation factor Elf1